MSNMNQKQVGQTEEVADLFIDGCLCDESLNLVFMSVWGRDTAIKELLGRMTLNASDPQSLRQLNVTWEEKRIPVYLNVELLEKRLTRGYKATYFGSLLNVWIFDKRTTEADLANNSSYLLENTAHSAKDILALPELEQKKLWSQVMELSPFPILDHWRLPVMQEIIRHEMIHMMKPLFGPLTCWRIHLNVEIIQKFISDMIRSGALTAEASLQPQLI